MLKFNKIIQNTCNKTDEITILPGACCCCCCCFIPCCTPMSRTTGHVYTTSSTPNPIK